MTRLTTRVLVSNTSDISRSAAYAASCNFLRPLMTRIPWPMAPRSPPSNKNCIHSVTVMSHLVRRFEPLRVTRDRAIVRCTGGEGQASRSEAQTVAQLDEEAAADERGRRSTALARARIERVGDRGVSVGVADIDGGTWVREVREQDVETETLAARPCHEVRVR